MYVCETLLSGSLNQYKRAITQTSMAYMVIEKNFQRK